MDPNSREFQTRVESLIEFEIGVVDQLKSYISEFDLDCFRTNLYVVLTYLNMTYSSHCY